MELKKKMSGNFELVGVLLIVLNGIENDLPGIENDLPELFEYLCHQPFNRTKWN